MSTLGNLRAFMDRMDILAAKTFYRTKGALDDIEAGTYTVSQSFLNPLGVIDDMLALFAPNLGSTFVYPPTLVVPATKAVGSGAATLTLGLPAGTTVTATPLQPVANLNAPSIPAADVAPAITNAGDLNVAINNLANRVKGNYKGLALDGQGNPLAFIELHLTP
jgi:hypothetical protein